MIVYEPNRHWFRDVWHLTTSWTIKKIINGTLLIGIFATAVTTALSFSDIEPRLHSGVFSLIGVVLSILLVFRTNTAYDRWWEGRKLWGALVNHARQLAILLQSAMPAQDDESRAFFARHIANFCIALKEHLRSGANLDELLLADHEKEKLLRSAHVPNALATLIFERIQLIYKAGTFSDADLINLQQHHHAFVDVLGACERIKKTPIPFSYSVYIKVIILLYGLMLPFGFYLDLSFYTIPLTMFIFFTMLGLELMAEEIEEPFGLDCNDLPTGQIANTIKSNVFEILGQHVATPATTTVPYTKVF